MSVEAELIQVLQELADELSAQPAPGEAQALAHIKGFEHESGGGAWKHLHRHGVANRARELVENPDLVRQGSLGLCGPVSFLHCWLRRDPVAFVKLTAELFNEGHGTIGSLQVTPSEALRNQDYRTIAAQLKVECPVTDWMVMSSMRDSANLLLNYLGEPGEDYADGSSMSDIREWLEASGVYSNIEQWSAIALDPQNGLIALKPGARCDVIVEVKITIFENQDTSGSVGQFISSLLSINPRHVLGLNEAVEKTGSDSYSLNVWTWARNETLTLLSGSMLESDYVSAFVAEV